MFIISILLFIQSSNCLNIKNTIKSIVSLFDNRLENEFVNLNNLSIFINETVTRQSLTNDLKDIINISELMYRHSDYIEQDINWSNRSYNNNSWANMRLSSINYTGIKWNNGSESNLTKSEWNINGNPARCLEHSSSACDANITAVYPKYYHLYPVEEWKLHYFFKEDYFKLINTHWFNYPPPSHQMHYAFIAVYSLLMIVGFIGNGLVIFMILSFRSLRTASNILVLNLAGSDILMLAKNPLLVYNSLHFGPVLGEFGCQVYGFVGGLTGTVSIMTLAAIALDRYLVIAHPLNKRLRLTKIRVIIWVVFIWTYSAMFAAIPLADLGVKCYVPEGYLTSCSFDYLSSDYNNRLFIFVYFLAAWCLPLLMIVTSYVGICRAVLLVSVARKGQEREKRKRELKLAAVVASVIAMWFISWTPYAIVALVGITGYGDYITPLGSMIPAVFCKSAAGINPFIYALNHPRLRKELQKLLFKECYTFERTQFTVRSWRSIGSRGSCKLRDDTLFNNRKLIRRASSISCNLSIRSVQVLELNAINANPD